MYRLMTVVFCVLLLTGCSKPTPQPVVSDFSCQVMIEYQELTATGTLDRTSEKETILTLTSPKDISGLTMRFDGEQITVSYMGMSLSLDEERIPVGAAVKVICETLDGCVNRLENSDMQVKGESDCGDYVVEFDKTTGFPMSVSIPSLPLAVSFSDVQIA